MLSLFILIALPALVPDLEARPPFPLGPEIEASVDYGRRLEPPALELPAPVLLVGDGVIDLTTPPPVAPAPGQVLEGRQVARTEAAEAARGRAARTLAR